MKNTLLFIFILISGIRIQAQTRNEGQDSTNKEVYTFAEQMPEFIGGNDELYKYLSQHIIYPKELQKKNIQGKVVVIFVVDVDGSLKNAEVINQTEPLFAKEALRVINSMPNWKPGTTNGKPVTVRFTLPIRFKLD